MRKTYVIDTNVLIASPDAMYDFDEHEVVIPPMVIEELDNLKKREGDVKYNAIAASKNLAQLMEKGSLVKGVPLNDIGGVLRVSDKDEYVKLPSGFMEDKADNKIIKTALCEKKYNDNTILVSQDTNMRIKADTVGLRSEDYRNGQVSPEGEVYSGRIKFKCRDDIIDRFYALRGIETMLVTEEELPENEYVCLAGSNGHSALGRVKGNMILPLIFLNEHPSGVSPKNVGQKFLQEALMLSAEEAPLVIVKGPAGTAKTFYSLAVGLDRVDRGEYKKILLTRANVKFDNDIGYLKGTEEEKIEPLIRFANDNLGSLSADPAGLFERGIVTAEAMAYMRGRSINDTYILIDEAQNLTPSQVKGMITRAGMHTKIILAGDPDQIDNSKLSYRNNGLMYAIDKMKGSPLCHIIAMTDDECVRSSLAVSAAGRMNGKKVRYEEGNGTVA